MSWGSFLLVGDMGQQLDLGAQAEELGRLRRGLARRRSKDSDQDAEIAALARENLNLKVGLAALVRLLVSRGLVGPEEIANLVGVLEESEAATALPSGVAPESTHGAEVEAAGLDAPRPPLRLVGSSDSDEVPRPVRGHGSRRRAMQVSKVPENLARAGGRP